MKDIREIYRRFFEGEINSFADGGEFTPISKPSHLNDLIPPDELDLSWGNTSSIFTNNELLEEQNSTTPLTLQDLYKETGETIPDYTAKAQPVVTSPTVAKSAPVAPRQTTQVQAPQQVVSQPVQKAPVVQPKKVAQKSPTYRVAGPDNRYNLTEGTIKGKDGKSYTLAQLEERNKQLLAMERDAKKYSNEQRMQFFAERTRNLGDITTFKKTKENIKNQEMRFDEKTGNFIYNGKSYNPDNVKGHNKLIDEIRKTDNSFSAHMNFLRVAWDKASFNSKNRKKALGGEIEYFPDGGQKTAKAQPVVTSPTVAKSAPVAPRQTTQVQAPQQVVSQPVQKAPYGFTQGVNDQIQNSFDTLSNQGFQTFVNTSGEFGSHLVDNDYYNNNMTVAQSNINRYGLDENGNLKKFRIKKGQTYDTTLDKFYNSNEVQNQLAEDDRRMEEFFNRLGSNQSFEIGDDLRMIGESMAFDVNDYDYETDSARNVAKGANLAKGIFAGLDAVVGGARDLYSGYAQQKRNQQSKLDFQKKQRVNLEKQKTQLGAKGGKIGEILDMFREEEDNSDQEYRKPLTEAQKMSGAYIQQMPTGSEEINAEVEDKEYIQHNDGGVQQVVGRTHEEGGERLNLEEGTKVVSDRIKIGTENAKLLKGYGVDVRPTDTFAKVISKFSKQTGFDEINQEQESYFEKLQKVTKSTNSNDITTELNNQHLSNKINELEEKKTFVEGMRSEFTDLVFNLQEAHKEKHGITGEEGYAFGGEIERFDDGGKKKKTFSFTGYLDYLKNFNNSQYNYKDLDAQGKRLTYIASLDGIELKPEEIDTQQKQDEVARMLQNRKWKNNNKTARHFSQNVAPTQEGLQRVLNSKLVTEKDLTDLGVRVNKGKVLMGSFDPASSNNIAKLSNLIQERGKENPEAYEEYISNNFNDGKWYFRFPEINTIEFDSEEGRAKNIDGKYEMIEDANGEKIYYSNQSGQYFKTLIKQPGEEGTPTPQTEEDLSFKPGPQKSPYRAPILPNQNPVPPSAASPIPIYQARFDRIDPVMVGDDAQIAEMNRQASGVLAEMDGLTDQQKAASLSNLSSNLQKNIGDVTNHVAIQNAMNLFNAQQVNLEQSGKEEMARVQYAMNADMMWGKTEANQEADVRDYYETLTANRVNKFRYLTQDRQMHDMIENFRVGADGGIEFDKGSARQIGYNPTTGDIILKDKNGKVKEVKKEEIVDNSGKQINRTSTKEKTIQ